MEYITGWIIVGIISLAIYKLFELFVGKKERLTIIEKLGDKLNSDMFDGKICFPNFAIPSTSFSALKLGSLLAGMGLGLLIGYLICATTMPNYFEEHYMNGLASVIYGACVLLFGGLGLLMAFIAELKISKKDK